MTPEEYLDDLLKRLDSKEYLPGFHRPTSSANTVSFQAHREVKRLNDVELIPVISDAVRDAKTDHEFTKLAWVLGGLIKNTNAPEARAVFVELMQRAPWTDTPWMYLMNAARDGRVQEAREYATRIIDKPPHGSLAYSSAIEYLGTIGGDDAVSRIGYELDEDCFGICHPIYCIFALQEQEKPSGLPYLERAIERYSDSRKKKAQEICYYAKYAIETISTAPPIEIDGEMVKAWVAPGYFGSRPDRLAICAKEQLWTVKSCDSDWRVTSSHDIESRDEAKRLIETIAGSEKLSWHIRPRYTPPD